MTVARRILVVCLDNLGDAAMASCVLPPLRRAFPGSTIGVWVKAYAAPLFSDTDAVARVFASDPFWTGAPGRKKGSIRAVAGAIREIRSFEFDTAVVLNAEWRRALALKFTGIPMTVGLAQRRASRLLTRAVPPPPARGHATDDHRWLLSHWLAERFDAGSCVPTLQTTEEGRLWREAWRARVNIGRDPFVVFHPFAGAARRNWPLERWTDVAARALRERPELRFVVVSGEENRTEAAALGASIPGGRGFALSGEPVTRMKALFEAAAAFVGVDSGPGHVAAALGTPVVSLVIGADPGRIRPTGRAFVSVLSSEIVSPPSAADVSLALSAALNERAPRLRV